MTPEPGLGPEIDPGPEPEPDFSRYARDQIDLEDLKKGGTNAGYLAVGLTAAFHGLSIMRGPHWKLANDEALILATDLDAVMKQMLPAEYLEAYNGILAKCAPVIGLSVSVTAIVGKRLAIDGERNTAKAKPHPANQQTAGHASAGAAGPGSAGHARPEATAHSGPVHDAGWGNPETGFVGAW